MKIIIYARNITQLDGVGNSVLYFKNIFDYKFDTQLVSIHSDIKDVKTISDYLKIHDKSNILIYHFSIYDLAQEKILNLNFKRKIIYYHGITEPSLLRNNQTVSLECTRGLKQIKNLDNFDLYFANSSFSKNQFLYNLGSKNQKISFNIMPPINIVENHYLGVKKYKISDFDKINYYYLGTLGEHKNVVNLCDLFCRKADQSKLNIITSSSKENTISILSQCKYDKYNDSNIHFDHRLSDNQKSSLIQEKDCFISFSSHEGFCIPVFEAIYLYKPVLVKKLDCLSDYFPSNYIYLKNDVKYNELQEIYYINYKNINKTRDYVYSKYQQLINNSCMKMFKLIDFKN